MGTVKCGISSYQHSIEASPSSFLTLIVRANTGWLVVILLERE